MSDNQQKSADDVYKDARAAHDAGDLDAAARGYKLLLSQYPAHGELNFRYATVQHQKGALERASEFYEKARQAPEAAPALFNNYGLCRLAMDDTASAVRLFKEAVKRAPDYADAHNNLGLALSARRRFDLAVESFLDALELRPDDVEVLSNLSDAQRQGGNTAEAIKTLDKAITIAPDLAVLHFNRAIALAASEQHEEALAAYERASELAPDQIEAHLNRGVLLRELGRFDEAIAAFKAVLAYEPENVEALSSIIGSQKLTAEIPELETMRALFDRGDVLKSRRIVLGFNLGKAYDDLKRYDQAFDYFAQANALKRAELEFDIDTEIDGMKKIIDTFDAAFFEKLTGYGVDDAAPIFVLGMPRSGTSLTEQILSSHSQVYGAGEMTAFPVACFSGGKLFDPSFVKKVQMTLPAEFRPRAEAYLKKLKEHAGRAPFVTDKLPENFLYIGMIKVMLPKAKVVHCVRDAMDTCLSNFKNDFAVEVPYAYDQRELALYYNAYADLMRHWHATLPGFVHDVEYASMVNDPETTVRSMLDFCGLEFEPQCLEFEKNKRAVKTASDFQVRQPIYKSSLKAADAYGEKLSVLRTTLEK